MPANEDKFPTFESFAKFMEEKGYRYIDLNPDPKGTRYGAWRYKNYREYETAFIFYLSRPNVWFFKLRETPIPFHPLKGEGRFEAIYFHSSSEYICEVSHVEAEMMSVPCRMLELGGHSLGGLNRTSLTRMMRFDPEVFRKLMTIQESYSSLYRQWQSLTIGNTMQDEINKLYREEKKKSRK